MEALYESVRSWGTKEGEEIPFTPWKGVDEYQEPVEPTSLSANFSAVFLEVASLLNHRLEWTVILNDITQDKKNILGYKRNETVKFRSLERSMK